MSKSATDSSPKRKASDMESSEPSAAYSVVILESPFAKPDVRIRVFASEFHVHSPILKQHSAFFRRFLEYPEGATTSDEFKFTFVSVVDDDGEWGLEREAKAPNTRDVNELMNLHPKADDARAFGHILSAMYAKPYVLTSASHLGNITRLADFICALPVVSRTLLEVLTRSKDFLLRFSVDWMSVLPLAQKLRHHLLFKECMICFASDWDQDSMRTRAQVLFNKWMLPKISCTLSENTPTAHVRLLRLAETIRGRMDWKILKAHYLVSENMFYSEVFRQRACEIGRRETDYRLANSPSTSTRIFRTIRADSLLLDQADDQLKEAIDTALQNNRILDIIAGADQYELDDRFYCADIDDKELPWDLEETDW